jgi:hypothetical protein
VPLSACRSVEAVVASSSFFRQSKGTCKLIYDLADPVLLPIARDLQNWQH